MWLSLVVAVVLVLVVGLVIMVTVAVVVITGVMCAVHWDIYPRWLYSRQQG